VFRPHSAERLVGRWTRTALDARALGRPVPLIFRLHSMRPRTETQQLSRGAPGYFRRTSVGYTRLSHVTDGRLRLVLQTRLGLTSPNPPAAGYSHPTTYLFVTPRLCLRLPSGIHHWTTLAFSYPSAPSAWGVDFLRSSGHRTPKGTTQAAGHARHTTTESRAIAVRPRTA
jgi:hypothetical protein